MRVDNLEKEICVVKEPQLEFLYYQDVKSRKKNDTLNVFKYDDRLHNFKVAGKLQKCTPVKALGGMMAKHTVSVYDLIDDYEQGKAISKEMWAEKIGDSINYLLLLTALLEE